jgi:hypothetical protein
MKAQRTARRVKAVSKTARPVAGNHDDPEYDEFLRRINARFVENLRGPLFTTDTKGLFEAYLAAMPESERQYHNCHSCKTFIERFGGLVTIGADGRTMPAFWNVEDAPLAYQQPIADIERLVRRAKVTGAYLSSEKVWGNPITGIWHHFAITPPPAILFRRLTQTAGQAMAEKKEDFKTVIAALNDFTQPMIETALTLLRTESLYRSEKVLGQAEWLLNLHTARAAAKGQARTNVVWLAIALAPAGFCHPRASMIGSLLEDIAAGLPFSDVSRKFAAKMHPLQYQRPQAAPSAGNIAQAEKVIAQLAAAGSLRRRFARLDDLQALWLPKAENQEPKGDGVFSHLKAKGKESPSQIIPPAITMTWDKFARTVLADAQQIEFYVPSGSNSYTALVTAADPEAPPILQWDREDRRNPVSWYVWHGGSQPSQFGLTSGRFVKANAITLKPSMWHESHDHQGQAVIFILDGAKESRFNGGLALFPEILKAEFHGIRSTIEAYSRGAVIEESESASACGIMLDKGGRWNALFRVTSNGQKVDYKLDRWD